MPVFPQRVLFGYQGRRDIMTTSIKILPIVTAHQTFQWVLPLKLLNVPLSETKRRPWL